MDEDKLIKAVNQGNVSKAVLEELEDRFAAIENVLTDGWKTTKAADTEQRETLWYQLNALKQLKKSFKRDIDNAKIAQKEIEMNAMTK